MPAPSPPLPAPFGKYELLERIGTGGMAEVFLARSFGMAGFEKRLVIKRIRPEHADNPQFISLFINEAKIGVHLNHPNIVTVYELGKVGEAWYIAMEHLHGRDLNKLRRALRSAEQPFPAVQAVNIVAEVLRGLAFAHGTSDPDAGGMALVHRDVSPHNIFVTFAGEVKLVDFGIARLLDMEEPPAAGPGSAPTRPPGGGKFAYMSPEQARGEVFDHRADLFAAGLVLWELLTGRRAYGQADAEAKLAAVRAADLPRLTEAGGPDDARLQAILDRALAPGPDDRYPGAAEFEEDLRAWMYATRAHTGRRTISELVQSTFPEASRHDPAALDLRRLADDVARLDPDASSHSGTPTPAPRSAPRSAARVAREHTDGTGVLGEVLRGEADERKRVVVMVVDVDGFTDVSIRAEPEALFRRHLQLLRWVREVVDAHGGRVQRAQDDQIYVFFGFPRTRTDDARRALTCGLELQRRLPEIHDKGVVVELAIGIHTGDITASGSGSRLRYMARGNTTRLARRLSEQSDHRQVLASEEVFRATEGAFEVQRGPWLLGRGGRPPVPSYLVQRRHPGGRRGRAGPWLKRDRELAILGDGLRALSDGEGRTVVVVGDQGTGKSRLVAEITSIAARRQLSAYVGRAEPFGPPLHVLRELIASILGLDAPPADGLPRHQLDRLRQLGLFPHDVSAVRRLFETTTRVGETSEVWTATRRILEGLAADSPRMVVLEDVHHLGERDLQQLAHLTRRLASAPVLFLVTHQPQPRQPLPGDTIRLGPLPPALQRRLVASRLGVDTLDDTLAALIADTCEGNPRYIEELLTWLEGEHRVERQGRVARLAEGPELQLPDSLAGLIAARIDTLDPAAKGALQLAATLGSTFRMTLLGEVMGLDDPMPIASELAARGLVRPDDASDRWSFASAFVREAALRGILGVQRRDYHRLVADALEAHYGDDTARHAAELAGHCGHGGRSLDAARYAYLAGQRLEDDQALQRARTWYRRGLGWVDDAPPTPATWDARVQGEAMLRLALGRVELLLGDIRAGTASLRLALEVTSEAGLPWLEAQAQLQLGRHHLDTGDLHQARAHLDQATRLTRWEDDPQLQLDVLEARATLAEYDGDIPTALQLLGDALDATTQAPLRARCLVALANVHLHTGDLDEAEPMLHQALGAARHAEDRILEGRVLNNLGLLHAWRGRPDDAIHSFRQALRVREDIGYTRGIAVNHHNIGDVHFMRGDLDRAYVAFARSRDLADDMGWARGVALNEVYLAYIDGVRAHDGPDPVDPEGLPVGLDRIAAAMAEAERFGDAEIVATGHLLAGRLLLAVGQDPAAERHLDQAAHIAADRRFQALSQLVDEARSPSTAEA